jgi:hypothetical protein
MTRADALKKLTRIFGKKLGWQEIESLPRDSGRRDAANAGYANARMQYESAVTLRNQRRDEILSADSTYQHLAAKAVELRIERDRLEGESRAYRIWVWVKTSFGFDEIVVQGDNWADVVQRAEEKKRKSA